MRDCHITRAHGGKEDIFVLLQKQDLVIKEILNTNDHYLLILLN